MQITPPLSTGVCDKCCAKGPVRLFEVLTDHRTSLAKKLCDGCWPGILSKVISMIH